MKLDIFSQLPSKPGELFYEISLRVRLLFRLMMDKRISPLLKAIPLASALYWIWPIDLMPIIPLDDAGIVGLGLYLFFELCPQELVQQHLLQLRSGISQPAAYSADEDVIDTEFIELKDD